MPSTDSPQLGSPATSELTEDLARLAARLGGEVVQFTSLADSEAAQSVAKHCQEQHKLVLGESVLQTFLQILGGSKSTQPRRPFLSMASVRWSCLVWIPRSTKPGWLL